MSQQDILIAGATHIDIEAHARHVLKRGSSNRVSMRRTLGGVAANVAVACAAHCPTRLITQLGADSDADLLRSSLAASKVSITSVPSEAATGMYVAILGHDGELEYGLANTEAIEKTTDDVWRQAVQRASAGEVMQGAERILAFDCNLPAAVISTLCDQASRAKAKAHLATGLSTQTSRPKQTAKRQQPLYNDGLMQPDLASLKLVALGVSPGKIERLLAVTESLDLLFANVEELAALTNLPAQSPIDDLVNAALQLGIAALVVTNGAEAVTVADARSGDSCKVPTQALSGSIRSVNGAGDVLAGTVLGSLHKHRSIADAVAQAGIPAAAQLLKNGKKLLNFDPAIDD